MLMLPSRSTLRGIAESECGVRFWFPQTISHPSEANNKASGRPLAAVVLIISLMASCEQFSWLINLTKDPILRCTIVSHFSVSSGSAFGSVALKALEMNSAAACWSSSLISGAGGAAGFLSLGSEPPMFARLSSSRHVRISSTRSFGRS